MDIKLHYEEAGSGFPLILLHGNGEDHTYFKHQMAPFAAHYRVIAVDTRGHGASPRGEAPFTLAQFARDLKGFLDGLGITKCHLLGFSDGGNVALLFALQYPDYVEKLILNGADAHPSGVKRTVQIPIILGWAMLGVIKAFDKKAVPKWELLDLMVSQPNIPLSALGALPMPTLVMAGEKDMIRGSHTRAIAAAIQKARLEILPGDHFLARRNYRDFNPLVLEFLEQE